jgi:hypothetical protein
VSPKDVGERVGAGRSHETEEKGDAPGELVTHGSILACDRAGVSGIERGDQGRDPVE